MFTEYEVKVFFERLKELKELSENLFMTEDMQKAWEQAQAGDCVEFTEEEEEVYYKSENEARNKYELNIKDKRAWVKHMTGDEPFGRYYTKERLKRLDDERWIEWMNDMWIKEPGIDVDVNIDEDNFDFDCDDK